MRNHFKKVNKESGQIVGHPECTHMSETTRQLPGRKAGSRTTPVGEIGILWIAWKYISSEVQIQKGKKRKEGKQGKADVLDTTYS